VNDTPYAALSVLLKDASNLLRMRKVTLVDINLCAFPLHLGRMFWQALLSELRYSSQRFRVRIVVVIDGDDLEAAGLL
jgi:hypothetical protein